MLAAIGRAEEELMSCKCILAIDAGTTGIGTILFDKGSRIMAKSYQEFSQITPAPGLLEHDPTEIWQTTLDSRHGHSCRAEQPDGSRASGGIRCRPGVTAYSDSVSSSPTGLADQHPLNHYQ